MRSEFTHDDTLAQRRKKAAHLEFKILSYIIENPAAL